MVNEYWREWRLPSGKEVFLAGGISTPSADHYVFGDIDTKGVFDFTVRRERVPPRRDIDPPVLVLRSDQDLKLSGTVASIPCPDTFEEAVAWMRMAAACYGGEA